MNTTPSYSQQTLETPNPIARYAHKRRYSFSIQMASKELKKNGVLLDYGCGNGDFLKQFSLQRPDARLLGYDPALNYVPIGYTGVEKITDVDNQSIDVLCCMETLEHLYPLEVNEFITQVKRVLSKKGKLIISVPIIGGPTLLLKEINRMVLFRQWTDYTFGELLLASFWGKPAQRPSNNRSTHKGFDFFRLESNLASNFSLAARKFSPFPRAPWWLNSQVFYLFLV